MLAETPALFMSHLCLWHFNGLSGSHRGGGGKERLPGKYCSLSHTGDDRRQHVRWLSQNYRYFWVKFTEVSEFLLTHHGIPCKRQSEVLTSANGFNYFSPQRTVWRLYHQEVPIMPQTPPRVAGDDAVLYEHCEHCQEMQSNTSHWWPRDQIHPCLHHFIPEVVHWEMKMRINTLILTKQLFLPTATGQEINEGRMWTIAECLNFPGC